MIIQVSEKHAEGEYGKPIDDDDIPEGEVFQYVNFSCYVTIRNGKTIAYISNIHTEKYSPGLHLSRSFKKNTVITFTQDKLS